MHPYLSRLGISGEVQAFFRPFYQHGAAGSLIFGYGNREEEYTLAWHRVPETEDCWLAGNLNFSQVRRVFLCSSAMDAVAYYHYHARYFTDSNAVLFLSLGVLPNPDQFRWISQDLGGKEFTLLYSNDLLGRLCDLKVAAGIRKTPVAVTFADDHLICVFRFRDYVIPAEQFSLSRFEKMSGFRFGMNTHKPSYPDGWFARLKDQTFNHNYQ